MEGRDSAIEKTEMPRDPPMGSTKPVNKAIKKAFHRVLFSLNEGGVTTSPSVLKL